MADETAVNKTWLITGGTGSLGQELTRHILKLSPKAIRIYSRHEALQVEVQRHFNNPIIRFLIGDVRDERRLRRAMKGADYVIHAAALKHVPVCEYNPIEAVRTNIEGSVNVVDCALDSGISKVLAVSTDKAVHPISLYGATKLAMEKLFVNANVYGDTKFACARFGNFYGSRGSVLELWKEQASTGTITVTDKGMSRYWINLEDAAKFCLYALDRMAGGEVFIPFMAEMGLESMSKLVAPNCTMEVIGRRLGEKLREELIAEGENVTREEECLIVRS